MKKSRDIQLTRPAHRELMVNLLARRPMPARLALIAVVALMMTLAPVPVAARSADGPYPSVDAYLAAHPGGTQINDREIAYGDGSFIVTVRRDPAAVYATADCPSEWFCFYDGVNFTYPRGKLSSCGFQDLGNWGWRNRVESVHYNLSRGTVAFLDETGALDTVLFTTGTGRRTIANVASSRNRADYVSRTAC